MCRSRPRTRALAERAKTRHPCQLVRGVLKGGICSKSRLSKSSHATGSMLRKVVDFFRDLVPTRLFSRSVALSLLQPPSHHPAPGPASLCLLLSRPSSCVTPFAPPDQTTSPDRRSPGPSAGTRTFRSGNQPPVPSHGTRTLRSSSSPRGNALRATTKTSTCVLHESDTLRSDDTLRIAVCLREGPRTRCQRPNDDERSIPFSCEDNTSQWCPASA